MYMAMHMPKQTNKTQKKLSKPFTEKDNESLKKFIYRINSDTFLLNCEKKYHYFTLLISKFLTNGFSVYLKYFCSLSFIVSGSS